MLLLQDNKIFRSIPAGIEKHVNLQDLEMWDNQLSGTIPPTACELQNLEILSLNKQIIRKYFTSYWKFNQVIKPVYE